MLRLEDILDKIQELVGAPQGAFYNVNSRIRAIEAAHTDLLRETGGIVKKGYATSLPNSPYLLTLPDDFLKFAPSPIVWYDAYSGPVEDEFVVWDGDQLLFAGDAVVAVTQGGSNGDGDALVILPKTGRVLCVDSSRDTTSRFGSWDELVEAGDPTNLVIRAPGTYELYPHPKAPGVILFSYWSSGDSIDSMPVGTAFEWVPFGGEASLNKFADALAYRVASDILIPYNPETSAYLRKLYDQEVRKMRHAVRSDPVKHEHVAPPTRQRYYYRYGY